VRGVSVGCGNGFARSKHVQLVATLKLCETYCLDRLLQEDATMHGWKSPLQQRLTSQVHERSCSGLPQPVVMNIMVHCQNVKTQGAYWLSSKGFFSGVIR
jgi:hypothetical protein